MKKVNKVRILGSKKLKNKAEKTKFQKLMYSPVTPGQILIALLVEVLIILRAIL